MKLLQNDEDAIFSPGSDDTRLAYAELQESFTLHTLSLPWVDMPIKGRETGQPAVERLGIMSEKSLNPSLLHTR